MGQLLKREEHLPARREERVPAEFIEFQPDSVEIEMRPMPRAARGFLYSLVLLVIAAVTWASLAEVERVVSAQGRLVTQGPPLVVQALDRSVVSAFHVRRGEIVEQGQPLVTLDSTLSTADLEQVRKRYENLGARAERLESEMEGREYVPDGGTPEAVAALERELFLQRREEHQARRTAMERTLDAITARIATLEGAREQAERQLAMAQELESMYAGLFEEGHSSKLELLNARSRRIGFEADVQRLGAEAKEIAMERERVRAEMESYESDRNRMILEELAEVRGELEGLENQLEKARWISDRVVLKAPRDGVILELAELSEGSVVEGARTLVTLVPLDEPLIAEVEIPTRDIALIRTDDPVRLKLEAFPFQKHGVLEGVVSTVSEDVFDKESPMGTYPMYRARIAITSRDLTEVPPDFRLMPGMQLTAEIKIGTRRVISYFIYPIVRSLDETMREP